MSYCDKKKLYDPNQGRHAPYSIFLIKDMPVYCGTTCTNIGNVSFIGHLVQFHDGVTVRNHMYHRQRDSKSFLLKTEKKCWGSLCNAFNNLGFSTGSLL